MPLVRHFWILHVDMLVRYFSDKRQATSDKRQAISEPRGICRDVVRNRTCGVYLKMTDYLLPKFYLAESTCNKEASAPPKMIKPLGHDEHCYIDHLSI